MQKYTSWEKVGDWYNQTVGDKGSYYHQQVILPNLIRLLELKKNSKLLDLACGQGVLARAIFADVEYLGLDLAANLIDQARNWTKTPNIVME
jgi:ubiquinone/menaquinone biosynthesis C-methylase UbiE